MRRLILAAVLALAPAAWAAKEGGQKFQDVVVKPGDTLWAIANSYLKDPTRWNELLKYNKLRTSDPTVALPGMTLRVPVAMIKENMRAASLVLMINDVLARRRETPDWKSAQQKMQLFRDDGLRTMASARARVQFVSGELLNLDENSMAILRPRDKDADLELLRGEIHASRSRVVTASARITPKTKDTKFSAKVRDDLSTLVQVYAGMAAVEAQGKTQEVKGGFSTEVAPGAPPTEPIKLPDTPEFRARALGGDVFSAKVMAAGPAALGGKKGDSTPLWTGIPAGRPKDIGDVQQDLQALEVGVPVAAYKVQVSRTREFERVVVDRTFDPEERVDFTRNLPTGRYWVRVAIVDLLGAQGKFSEPRQYAVGERGSSQVADEDFFTAQFNVTRPPLEDDLVKIPKYRLMGKGDVELTVTANGRRLRLDEDGNFSVDVLLREGVNRFQFIAQDPRGREKEIIRKVTYVP